MARKNRVVAAFFAYFLIGITLGVAVGLLAKAKIEAGSASHFEARATLYRIPSNGTNYAARDFISTTLARPGFLDDFITKLNIDKKTQALFPHGLSVVAEDASSANAEIVLVGNDVAMLTNTLDALVTHLLEELRSIEDTKLRALLDKLDAKIEIANERNFNLLGTRFENGRLPSAAEDEIRIATALIERRKEIELAKEYRLKPLSASKELVLQQRLDKITKEQADLATRPNRLVYQNSEDFKVASALSNASVTLKTLRQKKQQLVIEFNQDTPLRVTGRAKANLLDIDPPPTSLIISVCGLIGGLFGIFICSIRRSQHTKLSGLIIEKRLGVPVFGVVARKLTDFGERELRPVMENDVQNLPLAGIRSLHVALCLPDSRKDRKGPVVFAELAQQHHASHIIANLAVDMARRGNDVLVIETSDENSRLSALLENNERIAQTSSLDIQHLRDDDSSLRDETGSIRFISEDIDAKPVPIPLTDISHFDQILIRASSATSARKMLTNYGCGTGLVLCATDTRISKLRKAIANTLHGVVLCAYPIDESDYAGRSRRSSQRKSERTNKKI